MDSKELSLTWDDHPNTLVGVFGKLLENSTLVDCTIAAEGQYIKAHKVVLSACSPYFELLFKQENEKDPIIVLIDVKFRELKSIIDFAYCGKVRIPEDALGNFIATAESLQIRGLGGSHKRDVSEKEDSKSSVYKRDSHVSPVLRKHVRRRHRNNHENNMSSLSSVIGITSESRSCDSLPQNEESAYVPISFSSVLPTSSANCSSSDVVHGLSVQKEFNSVSIGPFPTYSQPMHLFVPLTETHFPHTSTETIIKREPEPMHLQPMHSSLPLTEMHSSLPSAETVVKSELEPIEEIYLPNTEVFDDSKQVLCAEESSLLESEDRMNIAAADNRSEQNSTHFSR